MSQELIKEGSTIEEATAAALEELGVSEDAVEITVLEEGKKRLLGSDTPAKVRVVLVSENGSEAPAPGNAQELETAGESFNTKDTEELSDEEIDKVADAAIDIVTKIAAYCGAKDVEIEEYDGDEGELILDLSGPDMAFLIGRHGKTLDALQTVTSAMLTKKIGMRFPVVVDVEGYKHRRKQKVISIAQHSADRALNSGRSVSMRPMSPQERRMVHIAIREIPGVVSSSEGMGESRHVVITPTDED